VSRFAASLIGTWVIASVSAQAQVITEIHYNPPAGREFLEFIEVTNEASTPKDLSGFEFTRGIQFVFPPATIVDGRASIVVCADVDALRAEYGIENAIGNYEGRLDASGEPLTLVNHAGIVIENLRYRDRGKWPVGADGTGHTLVLLSDRHDSKEPESWTLSPELGGTPGLRNFPDPNQPVFEETVIIDAAEPWSYAKGTEPFSEPRDAWIAPDFDDSAWLSGPSGFGYGDDDDNTVLDDMDDGYLSVAIRKRFEIDGELLSGPGHVLLGMTFDDGFCAFLNGEELVSVGCPDEIAFDQRASRSHEARSEDIFSIDAALLAPGENVLAIVGFNRTVGSNDFSLLPRVLHRRPPVDETSAARSITFNELHRGGDRGDAWVELHNAAAVPADLSGLTLTDAPDRDDPHVFAEGTRLAPGAFLVLTAAESSLALDAALVQLFLSTPSGLVLSAASFDLALTRPQQLGAGSEARYPDGGSRVWLSATPTPGAPNEVPRTTDLVINEIFYNPPADRGGEFLELLHRGNEPLDASGFRFSKGIEYIFPPGSVIAPGDHVVLAADPELVEETYGLDGVLGPYVGELANGGENIRLVDTNDNLVDEVRYFDGGEWPRWADGGGASLEVVDPYQDNDFAAAWKDSIEDDKTRWEELSWTVPEYAPAPESELHILLAEAGICRIDDVRVRTPGADENFVPNPDFEQDTRPWRIEGTHVRSRRITEDAHSGDACLEIIASGRGDSTCNRIETDTTRLSRGALEVSLWARWQRGASLMILHGEFAAGPWPGTRDVNLSNNSLGARMRLTIPRNLGTPGAENSVRQRLREQTGDGNQGPVIADVHHLPASPTATVVPRVVARVSDSDGLASVRVLHKLDDGQPGGFEPLDLFDDGAHQDGAAGDGIFGASLPLQQARSRVIYYLEARDELGAVGLFPAGAPDRTLVYMVEGPFNETIQIVMNAANERELRTRRLHSNDLLEGTFVFDREDVYHNVGLRYRGSPWGRPQRQSYRISFAKDRRFNGKLRQLNISNRDRNDGLAYFLIGRLGTRQTPAPASEYQYIRTRINGQGFGFPGVFDPVNRDFIEKWYGEESADDAIVLKGIGRLRFNDACQRTGWDEAHLRHMDESPENYRFYWSQSVHAGRDRWDPFYSLTELLDVRHTSNAEFDAGVLDHVDMDAFGAVFGSRVMMGDGDALFVGNGHNGYMAWDPADGRWEYLGFDFGGAFNSPRSPVGNVRDARVSRLLSRPPSARVYLRKIKEAIDGYWSEERARPWLDAMQRAAGVGGSVRGFLRSSATLVERSLRAATTAPFRIRTNDGNDFTVSGPTVELEGDAPVQIPVILVFRNGEDPRTLEPRWLQTTRWRAELEVPFGVQRFEFLGFDSSGEVAASTEITVSRGATFTRGDSDDNGRINVTDASIVLLHLFRGRAIACLDAADVDDSGAVNLTDAVALLEYLFRAGAEPPPPFPKAGADTTEDDLGCEPAP